MQIAIPIISIVIGVLNYIYWRKRGHSNWGILLFGTIISFILLSLKTKIEGHFSLNFNSVLVNLYRNEKDSNGWHSDDEKELGTKPIIASLSFGATRRFQLKHKNLPLKHTLTLENGDLVIMRGLLQSNWKHQIPKENYVCGPRINLTFRLIY